MVFVDDYNCKMYWGFGYLLYVCVLWLFSCGMVVFVSGDVCDVLLIDLCFFSDLCDFDLLVCGV